MQSELILRPTFWNIPLWMEIGIYVLGLISVFIMIMGIRKAMAHTPVKTDHSASRRSYMLKAIFLQQRVGQGNSGKAHIALFYSFLLLTAGTALATLDWDIAHYILNGRLLQGKFYLVYKLILDLAGLTCLGALLYYFLRRFVFHDEKVEKDQRSLLIIISLSFVILTGFVLEALRIAATTPAGAVFSPIGFALSYCFVALSTETLQMFHLFTWLIHGLAALLLLAAAPLTYYSHIVNTPQSIFHHKMAPSGAIDKIENIEDQEHFGINELKDFSTVDRIRFKGCTECGRCRSVCPAVKAGTALDPKMVVLSIKRQLSGEIDKGELIGGVVDKEALWTCTTCGACARVCPAEIPIPDLMVNLRRNLALEQGEFPDGLAGSLEKIASLGNPWGMDPADRLQWAKGLDVPVAKPGEHYDYLYWIGCSASYDVRAQKIARSMVKILNAAGVNFAVMREERCHAEFARRSGEEYLFQTAAAENIENLSKYDFDHILAACPHCFNTFKNEYPQFENGNFSVVSHVELIEKLLDEKRLELIEKEGEPSVTLHDACYYARLNSVSQAPRKILRIAKIDVRETACNGAGTDCCGAGGGQFFIDRHTRLNESRLSALEATKTDAILTECPHCLAMLNSAQARKKLAKQTIEDIAELVARRLA